MLQNAYFLAKIGADTAENEHHFAEIYLKAHLVAVVLAPGGYQGTGRRHDGRSAKFRQNVARFRLYRHRFLQENTRFAAFFKIYQIIKLKFLKFGKFCKFCDICKIFAEFSRKLLIFQTDFLRKF